jgi:hypothetical protein
METYRVRSPVQVALTGDPSPSIRLGRPQKPANLSKPLADTPRVRRFLDAIWDIAAQARSRTIPGQFILEGRGIHYLDQGAVAMIRNYLEAGPGAIAFTPDRYVASITLSISAWNMHVVPRLAN